MKIPQISIITATGTDMLNTSVNNFISSNTVYRNKDNPPITDIKIGNLVVYTFNKYINETTSKPIIIYCITVQYMLELTEPKEPF